MLVILTCGSCLWPPASLIWLQQLVPLLSPSKSCVHIFATLNLVPSLSIFSSVSSGNACSERLGRSPRPSDRLLQYPQVEAAPRWQTCHRPLSISTHQWCIVRTNFSCQSANSKYWADTFFFLDYWSRVLLSFRTKAVMPKLLPPSDLVYCIILFRYKMGLEKNKK